MFPRCIVHHFFAGSKMCWRCWMINLLWDYLEGVPGAVTLNFKGSLRFLNCLYWYHNSVLALLPRPDANMTGRPRKGNHGVGFFWGGTQWMELFAHRDTVPTLYPNTCSLSWRVHARTSAGPPSHYRSDVSLFLSLAHQTQAAGSRRRKRHGGSAYFSK